MVRPPGGIVTEAGSGRTIPAGNGQTVDADMGLRRGRWRNLSMLDGLPRNSVADVIQDREGYLWIGTGNGLSRYDGERFTTFTTQDGLADNSVYCLLEDTAGGVVGRNGGRHQSF